MDPSHGGPCQGIRNTIPALEKLGAHNEVVTLDDPFASFLHRDTFKIHALGPATGPWQYGSQLVPWLHQNLGNFDVVIVHGLWLYYSQAAVKAVNEFRRRENNTHLRLYVMPHGMLDPYFQRAPDRKIKAIRNWIYWKVIERNVINNADGILFTCEAELLLAREPFRPYHPKSELNVGYGIEAPPAFVPEMAESFLEKCPTVRDRPYILFLSRIHEKKGVDLLIKSYAREFTNNSPLLVIAGPGLDSPYGEKLQQILEENPQIKNSILFPGMLSGDAKWGAFYGCDAFVLPSHQENFGIAVVEALACSKPVMISNQVNIWREIETGGAGLVADNTLDGTSTLLKRWNALSTTDKRQMGNQARQVFEKLYAIDPAARRLLETFQH